jgi:hypothetical protein
MGRMNKMFGKKVDKEHARSVYDKSEDQSVIIWFFHYEYEELDELFDLENRLGQVLVDNGLGRCDGNEIACEGTDGSLWFYGPSAEKIFTAIKPILQEIDWMRSAVATLSFGSSSHAKRIEVEV